MLTTGNQLIAARALIGRKQADLAKLAGLNVNTIRSMEASAEEPIAGRASNVQKVQRALEAAGVVFLDSGQAINGGSGVRLRE